MKSALPGFKEARSRLAPRHPRSRHDIDTATGFYTVLSGTSEVTS